MNQSNGALSAIGKTPLIQLRRIVPKNSAEVWLKLESTNPTGSYKDRMAESLLTRAFKRGDVSVGDTIVEYTGGSTGTALAFVSAVLNLQFIAVFSDAFSKSKQHTMEAYGAKVLVEKSADGMISPELIQRMKNRAAQIADQPNTFYADQFGSSDVRAGYEPMGREIAAGLDNEVDFCGNWCGFNGGIRWADEFQS